jgi:hypothetical protein
MTARLGQLAALVWVGALLGADTVTLAPVADTALFERSPDNNLGATTAVPVGAVSTATRSRMLLRFDLAGSLPPNAVIQTVSLSFSVTAVNSGAADSTLQLRRLLVSWGEGAKAGSTGAPAAPGEASWNSRFAPATAWSAAGASAPADASPVISGAIPIAGLGRYTLPSNANLVSDAQGWLLRPDENFGWLLLSDNEAVAGTARRVATREDAAQAPGLLVEYIVPPSLPRFDSITREGDQVRLRFQLEAGKLYAIDYLTALGTTNWTFLANAASKFFPTNAVVTDAILPGSNRFYRLAIVADID